MGQSPLDTRGKIKFVHRSLRQKVVATAAVAVLVGGLALAAVSATGQGNDAHRGARHGAHRHSARDLASAASYLGISGAQLAGELRSGKTLAQVAAATSGKSAQGLSAALLAARQAKLAKTGEHLQQRVAAELNRPGGPGGEGAPSAGARGSRLQAMFSSPRHIGSVAASYLGVAPEQLKAELSAGRTLAQVAEATAGKSRAGLVSALVASRRKRLDAALASGRVSHAKAAKRSTALQARASALVQRSFAQAAHPG